MHKHLQDRFTRFEEIDSKSNICRVASILSVLTVFFTIVASITQECGFLYLAMLCFLITLIYCIGICDLIAAEEDDNDV
jgi:hypothetical protein